MGNLFQLGVVVLLIVVGYWAGSYAEKKHYRSIVRREKKYLRLSAVTTRNAADPTKEILSSTLVSGNVVISIDYFKRILAGLRNIFGGNVVSYETLIDRGRREAILRMKEQTPDADIIINTRIETSVIGATANQKNAVGSIEVFAYGTAITYRQTS
jgi:uncharacterized protein YbjQ (UPF0145 family)